LQKSRSEHRRRAAAALQVGTVTLCRYRGAAKVIKSLRKHHCVVIRL